ncbi:uncharacterized protein LOC143353651 [Halictus rubicundus]|uniref:uncharacterized protein LOC143353651 n=1 Tax=Halictus rubicundus TaxID=77578 RepID=UPI00403598B5
MLNRSREFYREAESLTEKDWSRNRDDVPLNRVHFVEFYPTPSEYQPIQNGGIIARGRLVRVISRQAFFVENVREQWFIERQTRLANVRTAVRTSILDKRQKSFEQPSRSSHPVPSIDRWKIHT